MDDLPVSFLTLNSPTVTAAMLAAYSGSTSSSADGLSDDDTPVFVGAYQQSVDPPGPTGVSSDADATPRPCASDSGDASTIHNVAPGVTCDSRRCSRLSSESHERLFNETVDEIFQQIRNELASALLGCLHRYGDELLDILGPSSSGFKRSSSSLLAPPIITIEDSPPIKKCQLPDRSAMPSYAPVEVDTGAAST
ncbi:hypothetical protein H0H92_015495, partial [Tricholoma furcatifolium]